MLQPLLAHLAVDRPGRGHPQDPSRGGDRRQGLLLPGNPCRPALARHHGRDPAALRQVAGVLGVVHAFGEFCPPLVRHSGELQRMAALSTTFELALLKKVKHSSFGGGGWIAVASYPPALRRVLPNTEHRRHRD
jgi:hypothetical protein